LEYSSFEYKYEYEYEYINGISITPQYHNIGS